MKQGKIWKQVLIYAGIIVFFAVLAYAYAPQVLSGKVVNQSDTSGWIGMTHEIAEHNAAHPDDRTQWTNSMFGGMPTAAMYDEFKGDWTQPLYKGLTKMAARPVNFFLISLIGAFLLFLAFGVDKWLSVAGAIAITFCSYNMQIIQVGHNTKMMAIAFAPWVLAGIVFTYRSALDSYRKPGPETGTPATAKPDTGSQAKPGTTADTKPQTKPGTRTPWKTWLPATILGSVLFALALSFQIKANHPQITYYLAIIILIYALTLLISLCASKARRPLLGRFAAASALLLLVGGIGIATNLNKLIPTYRYSKYTMRGGSELSSDSATHNDRGLDLAYATAWSYGIEETPNILIPDFNGGASAGELGRNSETYKLLKRAGEQNLGSIMKALPLYWGPQPFTAGPMYMGAITVFLFILGLCLYRRKEKWWLAAATLIAVMLAWGSHFMWFTRLWFNLAPMYNKFRTVSMALVILQIALPVLGIIVLDTILKDTYDRRALLRGLAIATGITAGFCLLCAVFPGIAGSFISPSDSGQADILTQALAADRRHLLVSDAWRSFSLVILCAVLIWFLFGRKTQYSRGAATGTLAAVLTLMLLFDLWGVGKRYLNGSHFVAKRDFTSQFAPRTVDKIIKEDPDPDYRVLDVSVNTFNSSVPSYHHKTIGGYSPVKLQRYQDLIDRYLNKEVNSVIRAVNASATVSEARDNLPSLPIVSMLNGKYIVIGGNYAPLENPGAFGNAWFVDNSVPAATPDDEIALLGSTDLRATAIIGSDFKEHLIPASAGLPGYSATRGTTPGDTSGAIGNTAASSDTDFITLTSYAPNELHYRFSTTTPRTAVFSEIYYPEGWSLKYIPAPEAATPATANTSSDTSTRTLPGAATETVDLFRADWILRAATLPAGSGELIMRFTPRSYITGERLSRASSILLILLLLLSVSYSAVSKREKSPSSK